MQIAILNIVGLVFAFVGALLLYFFTPSLFETDSNGGITPTDPKKFDCWKMISKFGLFLVALGFLAQLVAAILALTSTQPTSVLRGTHGASLFINQTTW